MHVENAGDRYSGMLSREGVLRIVMRWVSVIPVLAFAATGCGAGGVTVTGTVVTTEIYSEAINANYGLKDPKCGSLSVQIEDGAHSILSVTKSTNAKSDLSQDEGDVHTLTCTTHYSAKVKASDVYVVSLPKVKESRTEYAVTNQTVNRDGAGSVRVPQLEVWWKSVL